MGQDVAAESALSSLNDLRAFVAVAQLGSFSAAAAFLRLSQPSVSLRVQSLESLYGLKLLERRNGVSLTEAGRELFISARLLLARAEELDMLARDLSQLKRGRLKIGFSTPSYTMDIVARLQTAHPGLAVDFHYGNTAQLLDSLLECRIDLGVMTTAGLDSSFHSQLILHQHLAFCLPRDHPWIGRESLPLTSVAETALVTREAGSMTRHLFEQACERAGLTPRQILVVPTREALKEAVAAGLGAGLILSGELGHDERLGQVDLADETPAIAGIHAVCLRENAQLPAVSAFLEHCRPKPKGA